VFADPLIASNTLKELFAQAVAHSGLNDAKDSQLRPLYCDAEISYMTSSNAFTAEDGRLLKRAPALLGKCQPRDQSCFEMKEIPSAETSVTTSAAPQPQTYL
jgi:hypothetical protein